MPPPAMQTLSDKHTASSLRQFSAPAGDSAPGTTSRADAATGRASAASLRSLLLAYAAVIASASAVATPKILIVYVTQHLPPRASHSASPEHNPWLESAMWRAHVATRGNMSRGGGNMSHRKGGLRCGRSIGLRASWAPPHTAGQTSTSPARPRDETARFRDTRSRSLQTRRTTCYGARCRRCCGTG